MKIASLALALALASAAVPAAAQDGDITLKKGPGSDLVATSCGSCHTLEYVQQNSPFMDEKVWRAEVEKMINIFGAPVDQANVKPIVDYLAKHYGKAK